MKFQKQDQKSNRCNKIFQQLEMVKSQNCAPDQGLEQGWFGLVATLSPESAFAAGN